VDEDAEETFARSALKEIETSKRRQKLRVSKRIMVNVINKWRAECSGAVEASRFKL
jgi:hypothetical protein